MMKEQLFNLIRKHNYTISIYTEEIFERRCQEEIIRSDEDNSSFVYIEFDFDAIQKALKSDAENILFWDTFLASLNKNRRGSDIIGFLENESGIGMLLLDSTLDGWNRVKGRIEQTGLTMNFNQASAILTNIVKPIVYPTCLKPNDK